MKNDAVAAMMADDAKKPPPKDKLDKLRDALRELRDIEAQRASLAERQTELGTRVHEMRTKTLVDMFDLAKVDNMTIQAEGNLPPMTVGVGWHYHANLGSAADPKVPDFAGAIAFIKKTDPDLLKTTFSISFGLSEGKKMKAFEAMLKKQKIGYSTNFGVPWNTLTAWVKERFEGKKSLPLKLLGATVERTAQIVKPKASRAERAAPKSTTSKGNK